MAIKELEKIIEQAPDFSGKFEYTVVRKYSTKKHSFEITTQQTAQNNFSHRLRYGRRSYVPAYRRFVGEKYRSYTIYGGMEKQVCKMVQKTIEKKKKDDENQFQSSLPDQVRIWMLMQSVETGKEINKDNFKVDDFLFFKFSSLFAALNNPKRKIDYNASHTLSNGTILTIRHGYSSRVFTNTNILTHIWDSLPEIEAIMQKIAAFLASL